MVPLSGLCPRALRGGCSRRLGRALCLFPSLLGISRWNIGTNCLYEVEAGDKGQGLFIGEQHSTVC